MDHVLNNIYWIQSNLSVDELRSLLINTISDANLDNNDTHIGWIRSYHGSNMKNNSMIGLISDDGYKIIQQMTNEFFSLIPYSMRKIDVGNSKSISITIPKMLTCTSICSIIINILKKLECFKLCIINQIKIEIVCPFKGSKTHSGIAYFHFSDYHSIDNISIIRLILDNLSLQELFNESNINFTIRCYWAKDLNKNIVHNNDGPQIIYIQSRSLHHKEPLSDKKGSKASFFAGDLKLRLRSSDTNSLQSTIKNTTNPNKEKQNIYILQREDIIPHHLRTGFEIKFSLLV